MRIQIFWFSLVFMTAGIVYAAAVPIETLKEPSKQEEPKASPQDFKRLEDLPDFELSAIASKLPYADLGRFEGVSSRFQKIAQAEFKTRLGDDGYLWAKGEIIPNKFHAHEGPIPALFFSKDGSIVSVGETDRHIIVWEWDGKKYKKIREMIDDVNSTISNAVFSSESNRLALSYYNGVIATWDIQTGQKISQIDADNVLRLALSPDGSILATAIDYPTPGIIDFWDVLTGTKTKQIMAEMSGYYRRIWSIAFSPDGKHLASRLYSEDRPVTIWSVENLTKEKQSIVKIVGAILLFLSDGKLIAYNNQLPIEIWNVQTNHQIAKLNYGQKLCTVQPIRLTHDANLLAGVPYVAEANKVVIWHIQSGKILQELDTKGKVSLDASESLAFSPDNKILVAGCLNGDIITWTAQPKKKEEKGTK